MSDVGMVSEQASVCAVGRLFSRISQGEHAPALSIRLSFSRTSQGERAPVPSVRRLFSRTSQREGESGRMRENQNAILPLVTPFCDTTYGSTGRIGRIIVGLYARTAARAHGWDWGVAEGFSLISLSSQPAQDSPPAWQVASEPHMLYPQSVHGSYLAGSSGDGCGNSHVIRQSYFYLSGF